MTETPPSDHVPDHASGGRADERPSWFDDKRNAHKLFWAVVVLCACLFLADAFYHKHVVFDFENWFGFFGLFGFSVSFALVLVSRELRKILMRDEDYYDR